MSRRNKNIRKNIVEIRIIKLTFMFLFVFAFLIFRLYWIQIENHDRLKSEALRQRAKKISLYPNRGIIYDCNLIPLTNANRKDTLFVIKDSIKNNTELIEFIMNSSDLSKSQIDEYINSKNDILAIPLLASSKNIKIPRNTVIAERTFRYSDANLLSHVIGYINESENRGESGIEKVFDEFLANQVNSSLLYLELDENKGVFLGEEYEVSNKSYSLEPSGVKLTIDYHIQKIVEEILDRKRINGAVIVADVKSGKIKALASRPNFDPDNIKEYLHRDDMALYNKAIQVGYPPGSLFKIVVLLTALEENPGLLSQTFYCKGYEEIGNVVINCNNTLGHGHINLREGFAKSCNSIFIQLGKELGSKKIIEMAKKLGFGEKINIGLLEEVPGNLPEGNELQGPAIGNISIGQGSIEVTPIQITNLMTIIANDGIRKDFSIVEGITSQDGTVIKAFNKGSERVISKESCQIVKDYLKSVVEYGTAKNIDLDDIGGAAGKTGSAQAILNGSETIHGWFVGFYPEDNPKYVITVLIEEADSGSKSAAPIFEQIAREIYNINR